MPLPHKLWGKGQRRRKRIQIIVFEDEYQMIADFMQKKHPFMRTSSAVRLYLLENAMKRAR